MNRLFICFGVLFLLYSCDEKENIDVTRVIKNASSVIVELEGYTNGSVEVFKLNSMDSLAESSHCYRFHGDLSCSIQSLGYDSVRLVFNKEKVKLFCNGLYKHCIDEQKDIMFFSVDDPMYRGGYVESPDNTFTYTITEEDYQNAEPI